MGSGSFGNYDRTAQTSGAPLARHTTHEEEEQESALAPVTGSPGRSEDVSRTRATSVTEVADSDTPANEKEKDSNETGEDDDSDVVAEERRQSAILALARKYTSQSQHAGAEGGVNPFSIASTDEASPLNPHGPNFNGRAWAKALVNTLEGAGQTFRTSGVAFQNLNVFGFGSPTDYQKDVVNIWLEAVGLVRKFTGAGKRRIDILRNFDGVVKKGEMLVVLGPPGSGCSTFLKTIAGDYNGIFMDENSYFNYQGK